MAVIEIIDVTRSYQVGNSTLNVLRKINLTIESGEFVAIMGPSGSGKSTLMQIMGLLDRPTSGRYRLLGRDVSNLSDDEGAVLRSQTIGFIFQMFNLLPRTSAYDNTMLPMIYSGKNDRDERTRHVLKLVGLEDRMDHKPNQLSGGQQQRVAIARALVNDPQIIFADEPTGNLASDQADEILQRLTRLNEQGITTILVTHEPDIAAYAKRILHIKDGQIVSDQLNQDRPKPSAPTIKKSLNQNLAPPKLHWAELREHAASAIRAIGANKIRSGLSVLGILIGVGAVIAMLAIGKGAEESIQARLASLGSNVIMLFPGSPSMRGVRAAIGASSRFTIEDAASIKKVNPAITDLYPEVEGNFQIVYRDKNTKVELQGVTPSYETIRNSKPYFGRFFTPKEDLSLSRVALIGQSVVTDLFGDENPLGKTIKINHVNFDVIGLLPIKGSSGGGNDQDALIIVPLHTAIKRLLGSPYLHEMAIQCDTVENIPFVMDAIRSLLRKRHRLPSYKEDDFTLRNNAEMQALLSGTANTFSTLLAIVATISLLVGGVGIMNIMLVSVNERTREIGLRKAVGAPRRAILLQFLLEAFLLSMAGGMMGVMIGTSVSTLLSTFAGWAAPVSIPSILIAFLFSAVVGVVFGFWPAYKASLLSPIEALRYE